MLVCDAENEVEPIHVQHLQDAQPAHEGKVHGKGLVALLHKHNVVCFNRGGVEAAGWVEPEAVVCPGGNEAHKGDGGKGLPLDKVEALSKVEENVADVMHHEHEHADAVEVGGVAEANEADGHHVMGQHDPEVGQLLVQKGVEDEASNVV